jgi:hypothetical protein
MASLAIRAFLGKGVGMQVVREGNGGSLQFTEFGQSVDEDDIRSRDDDIGLAVRTRAQHQTDEGGETETKQRLELLAMSIDPHDGASPPRPAVPPGSPYT